MPVAVKVTDEPFGVDFVVGVILIPVSTAAVTVRLAEGEVILESVAVTVVLPVVLPPVTTPVLLLIVAIAGPTIAQLA